MKRIAPPALLLVSAAALLALAGCKSFEKPVHAARSDAQIAGDIQTKLSSEPAFSGDNSPDLHVAVTNGVATLSGQAPDDSARLMAATDASKVDGVREVVNDMSLPGEQSQNQNSASCVAPHRVHHHAKTQSERAPELASSYVPPAPEPAPVAPPPPPPAPACGCGAAYYAPAPVAVPAPVVAYGYGYAPAIGIGIYGRPGFVRPGYVGAVRAYGYGRGGYGYARPGFRR
jgi:hypothetical protein